MLSFSIKLNLVFKFLKFNCSPNRAAVNNGIDIMDMNSKKKLSKFNNNKKIKPLYFLYQ